jgi:hypothetical protein
MYTQYKWFSVIPRGENIPFLLFYPGHI